MHEVLVNRLGGLSLPRKSVVRLTDRPDMTLDVYRGRKTTNQQQQQLITCTEFNYIRNRYFTSKTVKELFTDISSDKIINFLKETNLFNKL